MEVFPFQNIFFGYKKEKAGYWEGVNRTGSWRLQYLLNHAFEKILNQRTVKNLNSSPQLNFDQLFCCLTLSFLSRFVAPAALKWQMSHVETCN